MRRRTKATISVSVLVVAAIAILLLMNIRGGPQPTIDESMAVAAEIGSIRVQVLATGTIQPFTRVEIRAPQKGRVDEVRFDEGDRVRVGSVLAFLSGEERISLLDAANSMIEDAKKAGDEDALRQAKIAEETARKAYLPISVTSPLNATVIKRSCQPGQYVSVNEVLFVLSDRLVASVEVDETDIGKIYVGQKAVITLEAFPEQEVMGKVVKISQEGRIVSNVVIYDVQVNAEAVPSNWSSGMTANVELMIHDLEDIIVLPVSAVRQTGMDKIVMLLADKPRPQKIETGATDGKIIEVKSGLSVGDSVLITGPSSTGPGGNNRSQALRALGRFRRLSRGR